ncbi:MAG: hypothetical protein U0610_03250 [bacterium]
MASNVRAQRSTWARLGLVVLLAGCGGSAAPTAQGELLAGNVDWPATLERADPTWEALPRAWGESLFTGNGFLGSTFYAEAPGKLVFELGDNQADGSFPLSPSISYLPRVPIGRLTLRPVGAITSFRGRIDLWNAEVRATVTTDRGELALRHFTAATERTLVVEIVASGAETGAALAFEPEAPIPAPYAIAGDPLPRMLVPVEPSVSRVGTIERIAQPLPLDRGEHGTAWQVVELAPGRRVATLAFEPIRDSTGAADVAVERVRAAELRGLDALVAEHRAWWHDYWPAGWIALPDRRVESFYWLQMYKHASATRSGGVVLDNQGPWLAPSGWPGTWWNLNVELSYSPVVTAGRLAQLDSLCDSLWDYRGNLETNVGPFVPRRYTPMYHVGRTSSHDLVSVVGMQPFVTFELGNLPWALRRCWQGYGVTRDDAYLRERLVPLLRGAVNTYLSAMVRRADGTVYFPTTYSPEYPTSRPFSMPNANYALSTLAWALDALLWANERLSLDDPLAQTWREVRGSIRFPQGAADGLWIAEGLPQSVGHRHYSHLLAIDELPILDPTDERDRALIQRSFDHWLALGEESADFLGYARAYAAKVAASLGDGAAALDQLERAFAFFRPNSFYAESWSDAAINPVIETPLSAADAVHRLVFQSRPGLVRLFVGTPPEWPDAAFRDLRAEGGFEVSALRRGGETWLVAVRSLAGETLRIESDLADGFHVRWSGGRGSVERESSRVLAVAMPAGAEVLLWRGSEPPVLDPVEWSAGAGWGLPASAGGT